MAPVIMNTSPHLLKLPLPKAAIRVAYKVILQKYKGTYSFTFETSVKLNAKDILIISKTHSIMLATLMVVWICSSVL